MRDLTPKTLVSKSILAGMDEAGRGSWAGPVLAAAVILPKNLKLSGLNDSKLLSPEQRETLFKKIKSRCSYGVGMASHEEIDRYGLLQATFSAFKRALEALPVQPNYLLIDGRDRFVFSVPHCSIIRGDQKCRNIAAASIVAKVLRDRMMKECEQDYPQYGFAQHKGYGTQAHQRALRKWGPCALHRKSYAPVKPYLCVQESFL